MPFIPIHTPLSEIIMMNKHTGIFLEKDFEEFDVPIAEIETAESDVRQRLNIKMLTGKYSNVLIGQLARHSLSLYEKFGNEIHCYHMPTILNIIERLENNKETNIRSFKRVPLRGLKHAHHNSNTFVVQNMLNTWKEKITNQDEIATQNLLLKEIYFKLLEDLSESEAEKKMLSVLLIKIMNESKFRKASKQTGEWIVFKEIQGIKYYLCLATHQEAADFSDNVIYERLAPCFIEFPELLI